MLTKTHYLRFLSSLYTSFFIIGFILLLFVDKGEILLTVNSNHNILLDKFFSYFTHLGNGVVLIFVLILAWLKNKKQQIQILIFSSILHGLVVFVFKKYIFTHVPRPSMYFKYDTVLHFVEGVQIHSWRSFPSGHTASAFVFALCLSLLIRNKKLAVLLFFFAFGVGYSRIYLLQHFYIDTLFGALIGSFSVMISYICVSYFFEKKLRPVYNKDILSRQKYLSKLKNTYQAIFIRNKNKID